MPRLLSRRVLLVVGGLVMVVVVAAAVVVSLREDASPPVEVQLLALNTGRGGGAAKHDHGGDR
jgi:hypothetical protein